MNHLGSGHLADGVFRQNSFGRKHIWPMNFWPKTFIWPMKILAVIHFTKNAFG